MRFLFDGTGTGKRPPRFGAFRLISNSIAIAVGVAHVYENYGYLRHLDRVPDVGLAQASAMQTENAFYYSYYNELVEAESVPEGLQEIIWDKRSEYPDVLNAIRRFNIYQEVVLALIYRFLRDWGIATWSSWTFFRYVILGLNGAGHSALSLLASEVSGNPIAGATCFVLAFLNRFQISRLGNYSSSNLRELWGIPILWMQTLCLWHIIVGAGSVARGRSDERPWRWFAVLTFVAIVSWQFTPFLLLLQATALYFVYLVCGFSDLRSVVASVVDVYLLALAAAAIVQFINPYLLTTPFLYQLIALKVALTIRTQCARLCSQRTSGSGVPGLGGRLASWLRGRLCDVLEGIVAVCVFLAVRKAAEPFATADTHVYEILCTKVAAVNALLPESIQLPESRLPECTEPSFNARLYLIMGVFNLLEKSSLQVYMDSGAAQMCMAACGLLLARFVWRSATAWVSPGKPTVAGVQEDCAATQSSESAEATEMPSAEEDKKGELRRRNAVKSTKAAEPKESEPSAEVKKKKKPAETGSAAEEGDEEDAELAAMLFFVGQFVLFFALGGLVNRLRVAFGPPMMVLAASALGPRFLPIRWLLRFRAGILVLLLLFSLHVTQLTWYLQQLPCIHSKEGVCQHLNDKSSAEADLGDLFDWMNRHLDASIPVLASMNLAGSMRLFTKAPLIVHPQFESLNLRKRVQLGYELYQCGTEASFAQTMKRLHAEVVIFEYGRCFFTPYVLDDKRKNCISSKHQPEDQLCVKLHANSRLFELIFANGGYGVFRLRQAAASASIASGYYEPEPETIKQDLGKADTWADYIQRCKKEQADLCGARLMELAATWQHSMKRPYVANTLRSLALKSFSGNGFVSYYYGRHLDYDAGGDGAAQAAKYYAQALRAHPNNALVLKEYIMYLDMVAKDTTTLQKLLEERRGKQPAQDQEAGAKKGGRGILPLLSLEGAGVAGLLCEAAVSARTLGMEAFGDAMWHKALRLGPFSDCIKHNWALVHEGKNYTNVHSTWENVKLLFSGAVQHEVGSHNQPAVRFLGDTPVYVNPFVRNNSGS
eukprot:TRINITY_DN25191_c0_g1_i1.p1 TRINITY_DN25191_c0_g1~~TRINITY_DN25191_c0_g1_i1.p1  ORF type:complete len:1054 (-),score=237.33 TRINITY_DN25191_c0_g1_i1:561-3722(-)